jgi:hypothetical protein
MRLYYLIWVDALLRAKSQPANEHNWKGMTFFIMTFTMAFDFVFVMTIFQEYVLGFFFYELQIPRIPQSIGDPLGFAVLHVGPPLLLNYILIFRNSRYEKLIKKYKYHDGKIAIAFMILGIFVHIAFMVLQSFLLIG